jgi:Fic family protein
LVFYLDGVAEVAREATETASKLIRLFEVDREKILGLGRAGHTSLTIHEVLKRKVATNITGAAKAAKVSFPTASAALGRLARLDIVKEITGRSRDQVFVYHAYLAMMTEPQ